MSSSTRTRARLAHAPEVVALQVDQHDVLGALLGMRGELAASRARHPRGGGCAGGCRRWGACRPRARRPAPAARARSSRSPRPATAPAPRRAPGSPRAAAGRARPRPAAPPAGVQLHVPGTRQVGLVDVPGAHVFLARGARARDRPAGPPRCTALIAERIRAPRRAAARCGASAASCSSAACGARARRPRARGRCRARAPARTGCAARSACQGSGVRGSCRCGSISCASS